MSSRKRKHDSADAESNPSKKHKRSTNTTGGKRTRRQKENVPVPLASPVKTQGSAVSPSTPKKTKRGYLLQSPPKRVSPRKAVLGTGSFYSKQKPLYLTPLERKLLKETRSPPAAPNGDPPGPPSAAADPVKKPKRNVSKKGKVTRRQSDLQRYFTAKPKRQSPSDTQTDPPKVATGTVPVPLTFTSMKSKNKPKLVVGAAFFSTGKKPTSMFKKSAQNTKPKKPPSCEKPGRPKPEKDATRERSPVRRAVFLKKHVEVPKTPNKDPISADVEFKDPTEATMSPSQSSSHVMTDLNVITEELKVVLRRSVSPNKSRCDDGNKDMPATSDSVFEESDKPPSDHNSSLDEEESSVYPIFGSKRCQKKATLSPSANASSTASVTPARLKERNSRRRDQRKQTHTQLVIDAGQKQFGAVTCASCGMLYSTDSPEDNFQHTQFHQRFLDTIKFVGWKKERVVAEFWDGKIILVLPDDPKYAVKKAEDVRRIADSELGFQQVALSSPSSAKTYLFINSDRMVVGCLVAENIRQAFRVLEQPEKPKDMNQEDFMEHHRTWCCSTVPEKALCGVSRVWVFSLMRRRNIATRLLDTVRATFMYGSHLTKKEIAFSDPTPEGKLFATRYCETPAFLVYNFIS